MPPWVNPYLLLAMASSFAMHFVILYVPFLSSIFEIAPHSTVEWIIVVAFSFPVIIIGANALHIYPHHRRCAICSVWFANPHHFRTTRACFPQLAN